MENPVMGQGLCAVTAGELMDSFFPPRQAVVSGFLPAGTYILAGAPKIGKSFFVLQLGGCVSSGQPFLGYQTQQSEVLYLALEDPNFRVQSRLNQMFGAEWQGDWLYLTFHIDCQGIDLIQQLDDFLFDHPDVRLVIIDTLERVREEHGTSYSYSADYKDILPFKEFADTRDLALVIVHHTRKDEGSNNPFDRISGTNGLLGAADGAFVLYRDKGKAVLDYTGRDLPSQRYYLQFGRETCLWTLERTDSEPVEERPEPLLAVIDHIIGASWSGTPSELAQMVNQAALELQVALYGDGDPAHEIASNALTRRLNAAAKRLEAQGIQYCQPRRGETRALRFRRKPKETGEITIEPTVSTVLTVFPPAGKNIDDTDETVGGGAHDHA